MSFITKMGNFLFGKSTGVQTNDTLTKHIADEVYYEGVYSLQTEDYEDAQKHFRKAASLGHISSKYNLALMIFNGLGSYPNFDLAYSLFQEAKDGGHTRTDEFIQFMDNTNIVMNSGEDPSFGSHREKFGELMQKAFIKIISDPNRQVGEFVYLISRDVLRKIGDDQQLAEDFDWEDFENNFNEITQFLDYKVWGSITKASSGLLSLEQLVYARCCIINEVIKKYPNYINTNL